MTCGDRLHNIASQCRREFGKRFDATRLSFVTPLFQLGDQTGIPAEEEKANGGSSPDALAAEQLALASQRARIYLLSRLNQDTVERLGIAHVSETSQISRLTDQCDSCIVLAEADRTVIDEPSLP